MEKEQLKNWPLDKLVAYIETGSNRRFFLDCLCQQLTELKFPQYEVITDKVLGGKELTDTESKVYSLGLSFLRDLKQHQTYADLKSHWERLYEKPYGLDFLKDDVVKEIVVSIINEYNEDSQITN